MRTPTILLLPAGGIGPEVTPATRKVIDWFRSTGRASFNIQEGLFGGASCDVHGVPLTDEAVAQAKKAVAVLLACIGGMKWDKVPNDKSLEAGLLRIRKEPALSAAALGALTDTQAVGFQTSDIPYLNTTMQIPGLTAAPVTAMTDTQTAAFTPTQVAAMKLAQVAAL